MLLPKTIVQSCMCEVTSSLKLLIPLQENVSISLYIFHVSTESKHFIHLWSFNSLSSRQIQVLIVVIFHSILRLCCTSVGFHHHQLLRQSILHHQRLEFSQHGVAHSPIATWRVGSRGLWVGSRQVRGQAERQAAGSVDSLYSFIESVVSPVGFRSLSTMKVKLL